MKCTTRCAGLTFGAALLALAIVLPGRAPAAHPEAPSEHVAARGEAERQPAMATSAAIDALESNDFATRESAAAALATHAEAGDAAAIAALIGLLDAARSKIRYHASWGLARAGAHAVPALRAEFGRETNDARRAKIAQTLGRIGLAARSAAPEMIAALDEPHSETAPRAAYALGRMRVREALPHLVKTYAAVRRLPSQREIMAAIDAIGSDQSARHARESLVTSVVADLESADADIRGATLDYVVDLLRKVQSHAPRDLPTDRELAAIVPILEDALGDPELDTLQVVRALGFAGGDRSPAVSQLEAMLTNPELAGEVERTLASIATPEAKRILADRAGRAAREKRIRSEYSVGDHQGRMRLLPFQVFGQGADGVRMETRFLYSGDQVRRPTHVVIYFESYSPEPRFEKLSAVEWDADGTRIVMSELDRRQSSSTLGVIEHISGVMPVAAFQALVGAARLEARLARVRFEITGADLAALRHFASKIPPAHAPASLR